MADLTLPIDDDGEEVTTGHGSAVPGAIVRLQSKKLKETVSASQALSGSSISSSQGSIGKTRTKPLTGSSVSAQQGFAIRLNTSVGTNVVLIGSARTSVQARIGPADRVSRTVMDAAIAATPKWTTFANSLQQISPSRNGVRIPTNEVVKFHVWGNAQQLYEQVPHTPLPVYWDNITSDFGAIADLVAEMPQRPGVRGVNIMNPFSMWHGHTRVRPDGTISMSPFIPMWVGVQFDGTVSFAMRDGSTFDAHKLPGVEAATDLALNLVANPIFYVCDALTGKVLRVDRHSIPGIPENFAGWTTTTFAQFNSPTSLRFSENGTQQGPLYVVDNGEGSLYRLDQFGNKTFVMSIANAFWIDAMNDGRMVIVTTGGLIHIIDPVAAVIQETITTGVANASWYTVSVDRKGTWGPANEFIVIAVTGGGTNTRLWRYQNGALGGAPWLSQGLGSVGLTRGTFDPHGHYPWIAEHHPDEAIILVQGIAQVFPSLLGAKPANYPAEDSYNLTLSRRGSDIIRWGTVEGVLYDDTRPSFTCLISEGGWSMVGCTNDFIAEKTFAEAAAFVQQGMIGSFPRPEIKGMDLWAVLYYIYRNSQRFLREGATLMSGLAAYCAPFLGQELPPLLTQRVPSSNEDIQMDIEQVGDNLQISFWEKHQHTNPQTPEPGLIVRVYIDEGLPEQIDLGLFGTPWTIPFPTLTPGEHSVRARPVSGVPDPQKYRGRANILRIEGVPEPETMPTWAANLADFQLYEIPNTRLRGVSGLPSFYTPTTTFPGTLDWRAIATAENGLCVKSDGSWLIAAAGGGHNDYSGNQVVSISLQSETPGPWVEDHPGSPLSAIQPNTGVEVSHYTDGLPTSAHNYDRVHFIDAENRVVRMQAPAVWGADSPTFNTCDSFSWDTKTWAAAGTIPNVGIPPAGVGFRILGTNCCKDLTTEDFYLWWRAQVWKWTRSTNTWALIKTLSSAQLKPFQTPIATDGIELINASDGGEDGTGTGQLKVINLTTLIYSEHPVIGAGAAGFQSIGTRATLQWIPEINKYLFLPGNQSALRSTVYTLEKQGTNWVSSAVLQVPMKTMLGPNNRLLRVPELKGVVFILDGITNLFFFRTHR
jgi:hypothetical protein